MATSTRKRDRLTEIIKVLGSYGFGHLYRTRFLKKEPTEDAKRLRLAFEELGPTFIKFGQILSTRHDLLPKNYIEELSKLRDKVPEFPFEQAQAIFYEDFGKPLTAVFKSVDPKPLASASIAQVHRATFPSGEEVVLKIQRPEMEQNLLRDIQLFAEVLEMTPGLIKDLVVDAQAAILEIEASTKRELDFRLEAAAIAEFTENNKNRPVIKAPKVYPEYVSKRILVEEYIDGIHNVDKKALQAGGYDLTDVSQKLIYIYLLHVFEDGLFHADPHPGNLMIQDGKLCFIDFGIYGKLSEQNRKDLLAILQAIVLEDVDQMMVELLKIAIVKQKVNRLELFDDIQNFFYAYANMPLAQIDLTQLFAEVLEVARKHSLVMPNDFVLLAKSLTVIEGVVVDLDGQTSVMDIAKRLVKNEWNWTEILDEHALDHLLLRTAQLSSQAVDLPVQLNKVLKAAADGRMKLFFDLADYDQKERAANQMVNRLVFAIIIAALILASALVVIFTSGTRWSNFSMLLFIGAGLMGLWLMWSILKSGRL